ncbi:MAG: GNAT family N-acetyltransferase [Caulobacterales bacterium]|nr:GNAT family N-acetyltransferase [Caulobacterales bacterium]
MALHQERGIRVVVLETDRLVFREAMAADAPFVLALLNSPGFLEHIGDRGVRTEAEAETYIVERMIGSYRQHGFGMWVAKERKSGRPVGLAGLVRRDGLDMPDVGYAFMPQAWGQGYAQEAAAGVMRHAREVLGIGPLAAITSPDNYASMAVLKKVGFTFQGMITLPGAEQESTYFTA